MARVTPTPEGNIVALFCGNLALAMVLRRHPEWHFLPLPPPGVTIVYFWVIGLGVFLLIYVFFIVFIPHSHPGSLCGLAFPDEHQDM